MFVQVMGFVALDKCACFHSEETGHWDGTFCDQCAFGYDIASGCKTKLNPLLRLGTNSANPLNVATASASINTATALFDASLDFDLGSNSFWGFKIEVSGDVKPDDVLSVSGTDGTCRLPVSRPIVRGFGADCVAITSQNSTHLYLHGRASGAYYLNILRTLNYTANNLGNTETRRITITITEETRDDEAYYTCPNSNHMYILASTQGQIDFASSIESAKQTTCPLYGDPPQCKLLSIESVAENECIKNLFASQYAGQFYLGAQRIIDHGITDDNFNTRAVFTNPFYPVSEQDMDMYFEWISPLVNGDNTMEGNKGRGTLNFWRNKTTDSAPLAYSFNIIMPSQDPQTQPGDYLVMNADGTWKIVADNHTTIRYFIAECDDVSLSTVSRQFVFKRALVDLIDTVELQNAIIEHMSYNETHVQSDDNQVVNIRLLKLRDITDMRDVTLVKESGVSTGVSITFPSNLLSHVPSNVNGDTMVGLYLESANGNKAATSSSTTGAGLELKQQKVVPRGAQVIGITLRSVTLNPSTGIYVNPQELKIQGLDQPVLFSMTIEGSGNAQDVADLKQLMDTYGGLPQCNYFDTTNGVWSTDGVDTLKVILGDGYTNGTGIGTLVHMSCATYHLTSFAPVMPLSETVNWATLYYATISFGIGCICFALFLIADAVFVFCSCCACCPIAAARKKRSRDDDDEEDEKKTQAQDKPSGLRFLATVVVDALLLHTWLSVPTAFILGLLGRQALLNKYQRLAIWWVSVASYAIGSVGILGSLRVYWHWTGPTGSGDLLNRDLYTLLAAYWVPVLITSLVAGKGVNLLAGYIFARLKEEKQGASRFVILDILGKLTVHSLNVLKPLNIAASTVLFVFCALFVTAMYIVMIWIGLRFLLIQAAFFIIATLFALLIDIIILDPIIIMAVLVARNLLEIMRQSQRNDEPKEEVRHPVEDFEYEGTEEGNNSKELQDTPVQQQQQHDQAEENVVM